MSFILSEQQQKKDKQKRTNKNKTIKTNIIIINSPEKNNEWFFCFMKYMKQPQQQQKSIQSKESGIDYLNAPLAPDM